MIGILHGYLLEGSGSNLWTRQVVRALCLQGHTVHLVCQEPSPEAYDSIAEAWLYRRDGSLQRLFERTTPYTGRCIMHRPALGSTLPVYVWDHYEGFDRVVPMVELSSEEVEDYLAANVAAVVRIVRANGLRALLANHSVLMSVVAQRVAEITGVSYAIMPHGSAIEFALKKDGRFLDYAKAAFACASRVFVIGPELRQRVISVLGAVPGLEAKMVPLNLGVDTELFVPIERSQRRAAIGRLCRSLLGAQRGKTRVQSDRLQAALAARPDGVAAALRIGSDYNAKGVDADLEKRLAGIDWASDRTILYVGRLVASKGPQSVIAALPSILRCEPNARLLMVGHGPLRERLEAMLWALESGDQGLFEAIVAFTGAGDGADGPFVGVRGFVDGLRKAGELDGYFADAAALVRRDSVVWTGFLPHRLLCHLFPCADVAVFPSIVAEAGPLVFLEALACACFPIGTYFAGMAASIDAVAAAVPAAHLELMKLRPDPTHTVHDIADKTRGALALNGRHGAALRELAVAQYDWRGVAQRLVQGLRID